MLLPLLSMSLLEIVIALVVAGIGLYLINRFVPMDGNIKKILNIVVIIVIVVWLMIELGAWDYLKKIKT
jgi:multisubunit Na+/H+ antiporter MnhE subunit